MNRQIFIAGCGRSGTTLLQNLMRTFQNVSTIPHEAPFSHFPLLEESEENVHVIKRTWTCHHTLPYLPKEIYLIYCVRHPLDCLTSSHSRTAGQRRYHISTNRWLAEWRSLRRLQRRQPKRMITFVRYEDLITDPNSVQRRLGDELDLTPAISFEEAEDIFATSLFKWRRSRERAQYLEQLPFSFRIQLVSFCREFGYSLSPIISYVISPKSLSMQVNKAGLS